MPHFQKSFLKILERCQPIERKGEEYIRVHLQFSKASDELKACTVKRLIYSKFVILVEEQSEKIINSWKFLSFASTV